MAGARGHRRRTAVALAAVLLLAAGCGIGGGGDDDASTAGSWDCGAGCEWSSAPGGAGEAVSAGAADADVASRSGEATAAPDAPPTTVDPPDGEDRRVTAGSVDDNEAWDDYLLYRQWFDALPDRPTVRDLPVEGRQVLHVVDEDGRPVLGARISVRGAGDTEVASLTTYADGRALFHPPPDAPDPDSQRRASYEAVVTPPGGGDPVRLAIDPEQRTHTATLGTGSAGSPVRLDVALLLDATGSMGDEIDRLKANMASMAEQIAEDPAAPDVRFGLTVYRDEGDAFVTRSFSFTDDVAAFTAALDEVQADGGGDWPEALEEGLDEVVTGQAWREGAVQVVFVVADAPPHLRESGPGYDESLRAAAARGIKIFPIASSGATDDAGTEYVFRQLAQVTLARFVFLTYGADGASPGDATEHRVEPGSYDVLSLDELVVRLVRDELAALGG